MEARRTATTQPPQDQPYLDELDLRLTLTRQNGTSNVTHNGDTQTAVHKYHFEPATDSDYDDIDEPFDDEPIDVLDKIESYLMSDNSVVKMDDIGNQDSLILDDNDLSYTDIDSLTSISSSSSCGSLSSSGEFDFPLPGNQLSSISSMVNTMSPFFSKLKDMSTRLSQSVGKDLNTKCLGSSQFRPLTKVSQSTSNVYCGNDSNGYKQNGKKFVHEGYNKSCSKGSMKDSNISTSLSSRYGRTPWLAGGSTQNLSLNPSDSAPIFNGLAKPNRPKSFCHMSVRSSITRDTFSPLIQSPLERASVSKESHRVSVMSLTSAINYLARKG